MPQSERVFLSAEWRDLVMLNYEVEPSLLDRHVPRGTSLDSFNGKTYISLVGFQFNCVKLFGRFAIPFHREFEEVNLRFYVRRKIGTQERRGVVFISEIVPRHVIAATARLVYGENYSYLPMKHRTETNGQQKTCEYQWKVDGLWCELSAQTVGIPACPRAGSLEEFITEHYWGYSDQSRGGCIEYRVSHVPWRVWSTSAAAFEGDAGVLYGNDLGAVLRRGPDCAFVADGSPVVVFRGNRIR